MEQTVRDLLDAVDDLTDVEGDPGLDWPAIQTSLAALKPELEQIVGRPFVLNDKVQDATFFADLSIERLGRQPNWIDTVFALRFSYFGRLFTTWCHCESERLPDEVAAKLVAAAERGGFRYVSALALNEAYTGRHPEFAGSSWWIRFFDYV